MCLGGYGYNKDTKVDGENCYLELSLLDSDIEGAETTFLLRTSHANAHRKLAFSRDGKILFKKNESSLTRAIGGIRDTSLVIDVEFLEVEKRYNTPVTNRSLASESIKGEAVQIPRSYLSRMFTESVYSDVTINTKDGALTAHRAVLAASSPVFARMFDNDFKEKISTTIDLQDMSLELCKMFLGFLYGALNEKDMREHKYTLLQASHKYGVTELQNICEEHLLEDIDSSNVLERLNQAHFYQLETLKKGCLYYLFDLGRVYEILDDFTRFTLEAEQGLAKEIIGRCLQADIRSKA